MDESVELDIRQDQLAGWFADDCYAAYQSFMLRKLNDLQQQLDGCSETDLKRVQAWRAALKWALYDIPKQMKERIKRGKDIAAL